MVLLLLSLATLGIGVYEVYRPNLKTHGGFILICFTAAVWSFSVYFYALKQSPVLSALGLHISEICILTLFVLGTAYMITLIRLNAILSRIILVFQIAVLLLFSRMIFADAYMKVAEINGSPELIFVRGNFYYAAIVYNIISPLILIVMRIIRFTQVRHKREKKDLLIWIALLSIATVLLVMRFFSPTLYDKGIGCYVQFVILFTLFKHASKNTNNTFNTETITQHIFSRVNTPVLILNTEGTIIRANSGAESYLNRETQSLEGISAENVFAFEEGEFECFTKPGENGKKLENRYHTRIRDSDTRCHIEVSYIYTDDGNPLCSIFVIMDESETMRFIDEQKNARQNAEAANRAKNLFLVNTGKKIRTPMNAIVGMAELIMRENTPPAVQEHVLGIKQASANLLSIINNILDFSNIESGKLEIQNLNYYLSSVINDVVNIIRMQILEKKLLFITKIDSNLPNMLKGDEARIRQILLNLLSNAAKYTTEGFVSLSLGGKITNTEVELTISVTDSGIGIKEEDRDNIFRGFVEAGAITKEDACAGEDADGGTAGTGLGLSITRELCEMMGGGVSFESRYGKGSTFTARIPQKINCPMESPKEAGGESRPYPSDRFAWVENPENKKLLFYTTRTLYGESYSWSAENLGIESDLALKQSDFIEALEQHEYSHILISHTLFDNAPRIMEKMGITGNENMHLIQINEYGNLEKSGAEVYTIYIPVHTLALANILNNKPMNYVFGNIKKEKLNFTAPNIKLLLVDDVATNLKVAQGLLAPYKMRIDTCTSGMEAIAKVKLQRYDLILMDHMMPGIDGIEATIAIRRLESPDQYFQRLPIIALTANAITGIKEMFLENGLSDFLAKPIDTNQLDIILNKWIPAEKKIKPDEESLAAKTAGFAIPGLDFRAGLSSSMESWENYAEILALFCEDGKRKLPEINRSLGEGNLSLFTILVHGISSAGRNIGAGSLSEAAKLLETAGKAQDHVYIRNNSAAFLEDLERLITRIEEALPALLALSGIKPKVVEPVPKLG
jgi:signal transduction histidine kinase/CheY-like chemotaxis protein